MTCFLKQNKTSGCEGLYSKNMHATHTKKIQSKSYVQCLTPAGKHTIEERFPGHCWAGVKLKPVTVTSTNVLSGQGIIFTVEGKGLCYTHFNITEEGERQDPDKSSGASVSVGRSM